MPELNQPEDAAVAYVLGRLSDEERREFQARLAESAELRALVYELEEGAAALAAASPRRQPPAAIWKRIEQAVATEARQKTAVTATWAGWWWTGWAVAACLLGFLLCLLWTNRLGQGNPESVAASDSGSRTAGAPVDRTSSLTNGASEQMTSEVAAARQQLRIKTKEMEALRSDISGLRDQVARMSLSLTQQQALLSDGSRLKFFRLTPASGADGALSSAPLSPALQRAMALAIARELGWLPPSTTSGSQSGGDGSHSSGTDGAGVDFVDLPANNDNSSKPAKTTGDGATSAPETSTETLASTVPAFKSGDNTVLAIDSSVAPVGSSILLTQDGQTAWTGTVGSNATVLTIPNSGTGSSLTFSGAILGNGTQGSIQYFIAGTNEP